MMETFGSFFSDSVCLFVNINIRDLHEALTMTALLTEVARVSVYPYTSFLLLVEWSASFKLAPVLG